MNEMYTIRRRGTADCIDDPAAVTKKQLLESGIRIERGMRIGIAVGSRGIFAIDRICRSIVDYLLEQGCQPFIIPAMGSHGEATPQGQRALLEGYGITEAAMGVPLVADMEVDPIYAPDCECRVVWSRVALQSDGVLLVNRVKPHTDYHGSYESGLVKMAVIGLGKHTQALEIHRYGVRGLRELIPVAARHIFATGKILGGVAVVENRHDRPVHIEAVSCSAILAEEPRLLALATRNMPRLPVDAIDVLVVEYIGKDFSGTGLDTNVIGRMRIPGEPEPARPSIGSIFVRDISERSHGNALGIGLAEVITRRLYNKINYRAMYENAFTSTFLDRVKVPVVVDSDREGLLFAYRYCGSNIVPGGERIVRIRNTLQLDEMQVSAPLLGELRNRGDCEVVDGAYPLLDGDSFSPWQVWQYP